MLRENPVKPIIMQGGALNEYDPFIILFGSCAKQRIRKGSDIDICVIAETDNKRDLIQRILYEVDYDIDLDIVVYTPAEWDKYREDRACFANVIYRTGVNLIEPALSLSQT